MSIPHNPATDASRETARQDNGQFGTQPLAEVTDVELGNAPTPITPEMLTDALGDGPELTDDEQRVLGVLIDPRNHEDMGGDTDGEAILEEVEGLGDSDDNYAIKQIGELLYAHYARENHDSYPDGGAGGGFSLTIADGESEAYSVGVSLADGDYLERHEDIKYLSNDRYFGGTDTSGLRKAIKHASTLDGDFQAIRAKARRLGLVPDPGNSDQQARIEAALRDLDSDEDNWPTGDQIDAIVDAARAPAAPHKSPWPENDDERAAFVDWKTEAGDGDTNASFRDWFENPDRTMNDED